MIKLIKLVLIAFIMSIILGQLGRIKIPGGFEGGIYISDVFVLCLFLVWGVDRIVNRRLFVDIITLGQLLFLGTTAISLTFALSWLSTVQFIGAGFYWIRIALYFAIYPITLDFVVRTNLKIEKFLFMITLIFAIIGLVQFLVLPDFSQYAAYGWDPHYYRVLSTFFDPNYAGLFLVMGLLVLLNKYYTPMNKTARLLLLGTIGIVGVAILLTFSRSTYLALALGVSLFSLLKDKRIFVGMIILGILALATVPRVRDRVIGAINIDETAKLRLIEYQDSLQMIREKPLLGYGFNTLRYAKEEAGQFRDQRGVNQSSGLAGAGTDSSILFVWLTGGLVSLLSYIILILSIVRESLHSNHKALLLGVTAAIIVHSQFVNSFFYTPILTLYLLIVGTYLCNKTASTT